MKPPCTFGLFALKNPTIDAPEKFKFTEFDEFVTFLSKRNFQYDSESEKLVQSALEHLMKNRTALVIAHRLSTVQHADEILVMDRGKIVADGPRDQIMKQAAEKGAAA